MFLSKTESKKVHELTYKPAAFGQKAVDVMKQAHNEICIVNIQIFKKGAQLPMFIGNTIKGGDYLCGSRVFGKRTNEFNVVVSAFGSTGQTDSVIQIGVASHIGGKKKVEENIAGQLVNLFVHLPLDVVEYLGTQGIGLNMPISLEVYNFSNQSGDTKLGLLGVM